MVERQRGDERDAVRLFDELLHRYPSGALASEANEQRRRAQEHLQKVEPSSDP
jgi:outer membrane protein assembly factor BamD (BamD/ComL family)